MTGQVAPRVREPDLTIASLERTDRERALRRARESIDLLALGGLDEPTLAGLREAAQAVQPDLPNPKPLGDLATALLVAWKTDVPEKLARLPAGRERLGWILPGLRLYPAIDALPQGPRMLRRIDQARPLWTWLASRYEARASDLDGSAFFASAARDYRPFGEPARVAAVEIEGPSGPIAVSPSRPAVTTTFRFRLTSAEARDATATLDLLTPDDEWLSVRPEGSAPGDSASPGLAMDLSAGAAVEVPVRVELRPDADAARTAPPRGFLVRVRMGDRTFHRAVRVSLVSPREQVQILLSADPKEPSAPRNDLRVRPTAERLPVFLYVRNPSEKARTVVVEIATDGAVRGETKLTLGPGDTVPAKFGDPAAKLDPILPEVREAVEVRVLDGENRANVLQTRRFPVAIAAPLEYLGVQAAQYEPPSSDNGGKTRLSMTLRAVAPLGKIPCPVEIVLPSERIPGLLAPGLGTFRGIVPADGSPLILFAEGIRLAEGEDETGFVELNVDSVHRAVVFRTTFARRGDPTLLKAETAPALRLRAADHVLSSAKFPVVAEVDNPPAGSKLEISLGRYTPRGFRADLIEELPEARRKHIGFLPNGPGGALLLEASEGDWAIELDPKRIIGGRDLRARLLRADDSEILSVSKPVELDDRPPQGVHLSDLPARAKKGAPLAVRALTGASEGEIAEVKFFLGRPADGKPPAGPPPTPGKPEDAARTVWSATLPLPSDKAGPTEISVQVTNAVGLSGFDTAVVDLVDNLPATPASIRGVVNEGTRTQSNLAVVLTDPKNTEVRRTKTDKSGKFAFEDLPPGAYTVTASKETTRTKGSQKVELTPGARRTVVLDLYR